MNSKELPVPGQKKSMSRFKMLMVILVVAIATSVTTVWLTARYLFPTAFKPVELSEQEETALNAKLERLDPTAPRRSKAPINQEKRRTDKRDKQKSPLTPERYDESGSDRTIQFTERELNALLAKNTDMAHKLAIDLSKDMASAKLLIPLDPDFPLLGGKTLRVSAGLELRYDNNNPIVKLRGLSLWGVPMPGAWLGGIKNVDLVQEFGGRRGFWRAFAEGIENITVEEGRVSIRLKE